MIQNGFFTVDPLKFDRLLGVDLHYQSVLQWLVV